MNLKNQLYINAFFTITTAAFAFLINKVFVENLGIDSLGVMRLFTQLVAYLNLAELGIASAATYALYRPLEERNYSKVNSILYTVSIFYKKVSIAILFFGLCVLFLLEFLLGSEPSTEIILVWIVYVVNITVSYLQAKYLIFYTANQKFGIVRLIQGGGGLLFNLVRLFILIEFQSFLAFVICYTIENVIIYLVFRYLSSKERDYFKRTKEKSKSIFKDMKDIFWHKIAAIVVYNTDLIILSVFTDLSTVAIYSSYLMICNMVAMLVNIVIQVVSPRIGKYIAKNKEDNSKIYKTWSDYHIALIFTSVIFSVVTFNTISPFMALWMGKEFVLNDLTIGLIIINLFFKLSRGVTESFKSNYGFFNDISMPVLECALNLFLSLTLVQYFGLSGVIIGTIASNFVVVFLLKPILVFQRCFNVSHNIYLFMSFKHLSCAIFSFVLSKIIFNYSIPNPHFEGWIAWLDYSMKISGVVIVCTVVAFALDKEFRNLFHRISSFLTVKYL